MNRAENPAIFHNQFRMDLRAGRRLIGCWSQLASPITAEVLGLAGFDWLLFDGEHAPNDISTFIPQLMALKGSRSTPVVRPPANDPVIIKRLLDIGFYNFLVPLVDSAEDARRAVAATRYPPTGIRGVAVSHRSNMFGTFPEYHSTINDHICVVVQIETVNAIRDIDPICSVDGVDAIFVGPSDLSAALGHLGNPNHSQVQETIQNLFARARASGKPSGILAPVEADARRYLEMGATFVAVGSDLGLFRMATQALCDKFRERN
jgi:2-dehydro-3-deoxyglucarate aldolase